MKPLVATAATEEELAKKVVDARARISFYASTPQYRAAFAHLGLGDLADELKLPSRAQRWEEMPQYINDDILHTFVTVGTYNHDRPQAAATAIGGVVTNCEFSIPVENGHIASVCASSPATFSRKVSRAPGRTILGTAA